MDHSPRRLTGRGGDRSPSASRRLLLLLAATALLVRAAAVPPGGVSGGSDRAAAADASPSDGGGIQTADLRPSSHYLRWLRDELDGVEARLGRAGGTRVGTGGAERALPHGGDAPEEEDDGADGLAERRRILRRRLDGAADALRRTGAAYAAAVEMPEAPRAEEGAAVRSRSGRRHLRRERDARALHNGLAAEYNSRRHLSRHERRLRTEAGETRRRKAGGEFANATALPGHELVGTSWRAVGLAYGAPSSFEMRAPLPGSPITLSFDPVDAPGPDGASDPGTAYISGSDGCNRYRGTVSLRDSGFNASYLATTRMLCRGESAAQERNFTGLISGSAFFYEADGDRLFLMAASYRRGGRAVPGPAVAEFEAEEGGGTVAGGRVLKRNDARARPAQSKKKSAASPASSGRYQTSPLHQGYGTHYATIWVGTPPQRKSVIVDTGSHFTAFPCTGCAGCGEEHHTDPYFDPAASSTFRALSCTQCVAAQCAKPSGGFPGGSCVFSQVYTEGSSWYAYESVDRVFVGPKDAASAADPRHDPYKADFLFGCQTKESGLFVTQLADGIMGMSAHPSTLPRVMFDQGRVRRNMFSMCFRRELRVSKMGIVAGHLSLGGSDSRADTSPVVYARNVAGGGWYTVFVKRIYVREGGGQSAAADGDDQVARNVDVDFSEMNTGKGVIVDSGTTDTYLHKSIAAPFEAVWKKVTGSKYSNAPVKMTEEELLKLPTVLIQLEGAGNDVNLQGDGIAVGLAGLIDPANPADAILAVPATNYMEYSPSKDTYTPRIYFTETAGGVIGANAMQGHNVIFDWERGRVGFAESTCEYLDENPGPDDGDDGPASADCRLGTPSLSVSCSDSADLSRCDAGGSAAASTEPLSGLEFWTRVVKSPGTPQGASCEDVSLAENAANGGGKMEVNCDGRGVCREVRPCAISCANAMAHGSGGGTGSAGAGLSPVGSCGAVTWSACDYTCTQTRVNSVLMNDGKCHEERAEETTRECHVQACGRSDPCRVPFVVHVILRIRGAVAGSWNRHAEEVFAAAFADAVNRKKRGKSKFFGEGDVLVLNASPWRAGDDSAIAPAPGEEDEELGMQLVVEVSLFNHMAEIPPIIADPTGENGRQVPLATCHERDVQPLAAAALNVHRRLKEKNFVSAVVGLMKRSDDIGERRQSPFYYTFEDPKLARESFTVTSWTIKTDIGGDGEDGLAGLDMSLREVQLDLLFMTLMAVATGYLGWNLRSWLLRRARLVQKAAAKYTKLGPTRNKQARDDDDSVMAIADAYGNGHGGGDDESTADGSTATLLRRGAGRPTDATSQGSIGSISAYLAKTGSR